MKRLNTKCFAIVALVGVMGVACSPKQETNSTGSSSEPAAYCSPTTVSPNPKATVTITAKYQYRVNGNGAISDRVIRYAEVQVFDSSGNLYQCLETTNAGIITLELPLNSGNYTVKINTRANNSNVKAYVMTDPWDNTHYSITSTVSSAANSSGTMTASAASSGAIVGGAFNILDQVLNANEYLRTNTAVQPCVSGNGCTTFTVAPLLYAYWQKGFNPNTYLGASASNGVSFFLRGTNELYILGGINGNVTTQDTDHFDNTIILHEYGHFLEDTYSTSDSQGGIHIGNTVIDPRLAWSEAFANFFQAAVTNSPVYLDTMGNTDGTPTDYINENLETYDSADNPGTVAAGEGIFREFSLTRALWDTIDTVVDSETVQSPFAEIWALLTSSTIGFKDTNLNFRHAGLFFKLQSARRTADSANWKDWSSIRTNEDQRDDQRDYATPLTIPGVCAVNTIDPLIWRDGSYDDTDMFNDNDFYQYYHPGGTFRARITYNVGAFPTDLNLIIWKDGYRYGDSDDIAAISADPETSDGHTEEVNLTLPAGFYMINVFGDSSEQITSNPSASTYDLYIGSSLQKACPNPGG